MGRSRGLEALFWTDPVTGCRIFQGPTRSGYGIINGKQAHRVIWESQNGPLPKGVQLDHMCRRRACCAIPHLEPVSQSTNMKRVIARNRRQMKYCPEGHDYAETGILTAEGGCVCAKCSGVSR